MTEDNEATFLEVSAVEERILNALVSEEPIPKQLLADTFRTLQFLSALLQSKNEYISQLE